MFHTGLLHILEDFISLQYFFHCGFNKYVHNHFSNLHNLSMVVSFKYAFLVQLVIESLRTSAILLNDLLPFSQYVYTFLGSDLPTTFLSLAVS